MLQRALSKWWIVFLITVAFHGLSTRGRAIAAVDTPHYVMLADGFASGDLSETFNLGAVRWTKSVYLVVLATARAISSTYWKEIMVAINVLASGAIAAMLVGIVRRATQSTLATAGALLLYLGCFEFFQWLPFVLTDSLFTAVALWPFYLVARRILDPDAPPRTPLLILSLLLVTFSRPPGVIIVALVLFAELVLVRRRIRLTTAIAAMVVMIVVALGVRTAMVHDPSRWPFSFVKPKLVEFSAREKKGEVIYDRVEAYRPPPRTMGDHLMMQTVRFARFFQFTTSGFSRTHNLVNAAYFIPLYALALLGAVYGLRMGDERRRALIVALVTWIGVFAVFHALTVLDFDWRFRAPLMPHFIILASCGIAMLPEMKKRGVVGRTTPRQEQRSRGPLPRISGRT